MYTVPEVAELLKLAESTVYALIDSGKLIACHFGPNGGAKRITQADLDAYIQSCRRTKETQPRPRRTKLRHLKR